ncbi:MAG: histidine phosphatase family protein [Pseudoclavibacter sp.]|nr:histidine phosphatase family protein [Pseudoclavibacter sp.]
MSHYLYLVRHGEPENAEFGIRDGALSERGRAQAHAIGRRLSRVPIGRTFTSPLQPAVETSGIMSQYVSGDPVETSTLLFECVPTGFEPDTPEQYERYFSGIGPEEVEAGQAQMEDALMAFFTREREDRHTLLVTHDFVIAWFVREALDAPRWRWLGLQHPHCALTVVRVRTTKPAALLVCNDTGHLPEALRTGVGWHIPGGS